VLAPGPGRSASAWRCWDVSGFAGLGGRRAGGLRHPLLRCSAVACTKFRAYHGDLRHPLVARSAHQRLSGCAIDVFLRDSLGVRPVIPCLIVGSAGNFRHLVQTTCEDDSQEKIDDLTRRVSRKRDRHPILTHLKGLTDARLGYTSLGQLRVPTVEPDAGVVSIRIFGVS
jgi:hypothetical protein